MATVNGTIKRLVFGKGFGFVSSGDGPEYFGYIRVSQLRNCANTTVS